MRLTSNPDEAARFGFADKFASTVADTVMPTMIQKFR